MYLAATAKENIEALSHLADGVAYPAVSPEVIAATRIIKPSNDLIERFSHFAASLLGKIGANEKESQILAAVRDALLPKLISGELRLKDAEKFIRRAV